MPGNRRRAGSDDVAARREMAFDVASIASLWCRDEENPAAETEKERRRGTATRCSLSRSASDVRPVATASSVKDDRLPADFSTGTREISRLSSRKRQISNRLHVRGAAQSLPLRHAVRPMQRPLLSTTRRPVVLLVQPSRDDGLE